jgi:AcrR family transcriptional regulator
MPRSAEANRVVRDRQRANLVDAARRLIGRGGSLTMEELAREAGVSQGLAYRYFRSKEDLFRAMVGETLRAAPPLTWGVDRLPGGPRDKLERIVTEILERRRQNPEFYRFFFRALSERKFRGRPGAAMRERFAEFETRIRGLIVAAQKAGEIPPDDPDELVLALIGCLQGIWRSMGEGAADQSTPVIPRAALVLRLLGPRDPAARVGVADRGPSGAGS